MLRLFMWEGVQPTISSSRKIFSQALHNTIISVLAKVRSTVFPFRDFVIFNKLPNTDNHQRIFKMNQPFRGGICYIFLKK